MTAAKRRLGDQGRRARVPAEARPSLVLAAEQAQELTASSVEFPDERLKLMFIRAHPAIDAAARTPLMLQTVLGLDAARIASAFLVQPAAMGQRLSRAKAKVCDAGIAFELPRAGELGTRLNAVLEAIYAAYGSGWDDVAGADARRKGLSAEAIELGRVLLALLGNEPEVPALLALMLYCESRRGARRGDAGEYVPLSEQDVTRWSQVLLDEASSLLQAGSRGGRLGRFQLEAAIQSVHAQRSVTLRTDWNAIAFCIQRWYILRRRSAQRSAERQLLPKQTAQPLHGRCSNRFQPTPSQPISRTGLCVHICSHVWIEAEKRVLLTSAR